MDGGNFKGSKMYALVQNGKVVHTMPLVRNAVEMQRERNQYAPTWRATVHRCTVKAGVVKIGRQVC